MQFNTFYSNEFSYRGWKVMMIKAASRSVYINIFADVDLNRLKQIERNDSVLYKKVNENLLKLAKSISYDFGGAYNPNFELAVSYAKSYIDNNYGTFDLNVILK
jgi:hypothetical protein